MKNLLFKSLALALLMPTVSMVAQSWSCVIINDRIVMTAQPWYQRAWQCTRSILARGVAQVKAHPYIAAGVTAAAVGGAIAYTRLKAKQAKEKFEKWPSVSWPSSSSASTRLPIAQPVNSTTVSDLEVVFPQPSKTQHSIRTCTACKRDIVNMVAGLSGGFCLGVLGYTAYSLISGR